MDDVQTRLDALVAEVGPGQRVLVGICGPPGSGKSTLASRLARSYEAPVVPMDGFHLANGELDRLGLRHRKGSPETFDATGFVSLIRELRAGDHEVVAPLFDRAADASIEAGVGIPADAALVLVEGNYLLFDEPPWSALADLFDLTVFLDVPTDELRGRLVERHVRFGRTVADAEAFVDSSDLVNAARIRPTSRRAHLVVTVTARPLRR